MNTNPVDIKQFVRVSVVLLDVSGSMNMTGDNARTTRLMDAKAALQGLRDQISDSNRKLGLWKTCWFKIVPFNFSPDLTQFPMALVDDQQTTSRLQSLGAGGGTAIWSSLEATLDQLANWCSNLEPTHVDFILLTDGEENSSSASARSKFAHIEALLAGTKGTLKCACFVICPQPSSSLSRFTDAMRSVMPAGSDVLTVTDTTQLPSMCVTFGAQVTQRKEKTKQDLEIELVQRMLEAMKVGNSALRKDQVEMINRLSDNC
eukprot:TRINITY_DN6109_c0_g1_i1.p1 TRINITY_DN6109_c0_g1~~TRINITY_DN6109_c0_g1_i1.p1  ORF type:complete len:261 (+),score=36.73 TRINITY_DN6109_c0_g1_i1:101-883(+)